MSQKTYLGATAAFFPTFPFATMALVAKALLWVKALAEHVMETAIAMANKDLLAIMVSTKYLLQRERK